MTVQHSVLTLRPEQVGQHPDNLRDPSRDIAGLAASIKEVGVLVPLIVVPVEAMAGEWDAQVTHVAVDGNRRQIAAAQVGVDLPCIVRDDLAAAREGAVTMTVTALARDGWTLTEEIHGVQTLLDLGLSQAAISRASGRKPADVRAAKKAATLSAETTEAAVAYDLTLDQLATLSEWEGNDEAVAALLDAAEHDRMAHVVARLEKDRKTAQKVAAAVAALTAKGVTVTDEQPGMYGTPYRLDALVGEGGQALTAEGHQACLGHAVHVTANYAGEVFEVPCCTADPESTGHRLRYEQNRGAGPVSGPMTDEQKEARRELVRRNKEMVAAETVRREFVRTVIGAKKHAKTAPAWALARLVTRERTLIYRLADHAAADVLGELLGSEHAPDRILINAPAARHPMLLWATVAAVYESVMTKDIWRRPASSRADVTTYLAHLVELGYSPCETEALMINGPADDERAIDADLDEESELTE